MYIFFDIYGVLYNHRTPYSPSTYPSKLYAPYVYNLAELAKSHKARLVLTSFERCGFRKNLFGNLKPFTGESIELYNRLKCRGVKLYDVLPNGNDVIRAEQIREYIRKKRVKQFIIIDSQPLNYKEWGLSYHLVLTGSQDVSPPNFGSEYFNKRFEPGKIDELDNGFNREKREEADDLIYMLYTAHKELETYYKEKSYRDNLLW